MTQEEKQLLLKDICARLPYQLTVNWNPSEGVFKNIESNENSNLEGWLIYEVKKGTIKPYLRPMSSMTDEEEKEYYALCVLTSNGGYDWYYEPTLKSLDWLNAHYFDYRNLIEKGLALEAKEGMY